MFKQTLWYAISIALMRGISLLMLPILARYLSPEALGEIEILSSIAIFGSILVSGGLENALFRFSATGDERKRDHIASSIYAFAFILGGIFLVVSFPFAEHMLRVIPAPSSTYSVQLVIILLCFESVISVPLGYLRMTDQCFRFCFASCVRTAIHAGLTLHFLYLGKGVEGVLEAGLIAAMIQAAMLAYWQCERTGITLNRRLIKPVFIYSGPIIASGVIAFGLNGVDKWAIATFKSLDDVALYAIALKFSIALTILMQPYGIWWMPKRFSTLNMPDGRTIATRYSTIGLVLIALVSLLIGLTAPLMIRYLLPAFYIDAIPILMALILVSVVKEATEIINVGCLAGERTYLQFGINACSMISGGVLIVPAAIAYGIWGVVAVLVSAYVFRLAAFFYFSQKNVYLKYPMKHLVAVYSAVFGVLLVCALDDGNGYSEILGNPISLMVLTVSLGVIVRSSYYCLRLGEKLWPLSMIIRPHTAP